METRDFQGNAIFIREQKLNKNSKQRYLLNYTLKKITKRYKRIRYLSNIIYFYLCASMARNYRKFSAQHSDRDDFR